MTTWFLLDFVSIFPFDRLVDQNFRAFRVVRVIRLIKLMRLAKLARLAHLSDLFQMPGQYLVLVKFSILVLLTLHWMVREF